MVMASSVETFSNLKNSQMSDLFIVGNLSKLSPFLLPPLRFNPFSCLRNSLNQYLFDGEYPLIDCMPFICFCKPLPSPFYVMASHKIKKTSQMVSVIP